jgi:hypothetical protein
MGREERGREGEREGEGKGGVGKGKGRGGEEGEGEGEEREYNRIHYLSLVDHWVLVQTIVHKILHLATELPFLGGCGLHLLPNLHISAGSSHLLLQILRQRVGL